VLMRETAEPQIELIRNAFPLAEPYIY